MSDHKNSSSGYLFGITCFTFWGLLPIFWKTLEHVDPVILLAQRVVWSLVFMLVLLLIKNQWNWVKQALTDTDTLIRYTLASLLLGGNWGLYIWAVNNNYVIETSLGYYISPLLTVVFGAMFLNERLRRVQWLSIVIAGLGVAYLTYQYGEIPIVGSILGVTFAIYSVIKKNGKLNALESMTYESAILFPFALMYIIYLHRIGKGTFGEVNRTTDLLLIMTGVVTQTPMLLFTAAMKRLNVTTLGVISYLSPTTAFLLAVFYFDEPLSENDLIGFAFIWVALIVFTFEGIVTHKMRRRNVPL